MDVSKTATGISTTQRLFLDHVLYNKYSEDLSANCAEYRNVSSVCNRGPKYTVTLNDRCTSIQMKPSVFLAYKECATVGRTPLTLRHEPARHNI